MSLISVSMSGSVDTAGTVVIPVFGGGVVVVVDRPVPLHAEPRVETVLPG